MKKEEYKYQQPSRSYKEDGIVFLIVTKTPHWFDRHSQICKELPIGALTWANLRNFKKNANGLYRLSLTQAVIIENNQYSFNFDPSCFEVLHTSTQKLNRDDT